MDQVRRNTTGRRSAQATERRRRSRSPPASTAPTPTTANSSTSAPVKGRLDEPPGVVGLAALVVELYGSPLDGLMPTDVAATVGGAQPV
jgi:hypothetical protein